MSPGYKAFDIQPFKPEFTHTLQPARPVQGVVTAADTGKPLAGIVVEVTPMGPHGGQAFSTRTDAQGRYRVSGHAATGRAPSPLYITTVSPPADSGYLCISNDHDKGWPAGAKFLEKNFALPRGRLLHGTVLDADTKKPIAGASIVYQPKQGNPHNRDEYDLRNRVLTDKDGRFTITGLAGEGLLVVEGPSSDYLRVTLPRAETRSNRDLFPHGYVTMDVPEKEEPAPAEIKLRKGATLEARVLGPNGKPVPWVYAGCRQLQACQINRNDGSERFDKGLFRMPGSDPKETYRIFFVQPELHLGAVADLKYDGKPAEIRLQPTASVRGKLVDPDGSPPRSYQAYALLLATKGEDPPTGRSWFFDQDRFLIYSNLTQSFGETKQNMDGSFVVEDLIPGTRLYIVGAAGRLAVRVPATLKPGENKDVGTLTLTKEEAPSSANESPADAKTAWEPYQPGMDGPWDVARVAHLHRQAGFGATCAQIRRDVAGGYEASLRRILDGEMHGPDGRPARQFAELAAVMEDDARRRPTIERVQLWWLFRLLFTPHPLAEKMTLAWHSHYATSNDKVGDPLRMLEQHLTLRQLWRARVSQLHGALLRDPAMLKWLDGSDNTRDRPNENLAREFLELFALGEGHYTEQDVREVARALTGWQEDGTGQEMRFVIRQHDAGPKVILDACGNWGEADVVRIVCRQPAAALHIARRLYRTFISDTDDLPVQLLEPLADAMRTGGDVAIDRGLEGVLHSRLFHSPACWGKRVKSPVEYVIGALRGCEAFAPPPDLADIEIHLTKMGQRLFYPPNVAGWPGGLSWLGGSTILARSRFAATFADPASPYGPRHLQQLAERLERKSSKDRLEFFAALLLGSPLRDPKQFADGAASSCGRLVQSLLLLPEAQVC